MSNGQARSDRPGRARRSVLITIMALGSVVTLTAVNGVFAVFTDRATTGTNSASSRSEPRSADIQIAEGIRDPQTGTIVCGTFDDDLTSGIVTATDMAPLGNAAFSNLCLKNVGSRQVDLTASVIDLVDTDHACTGDEAVLDSTCGDGQEGEFSAQLGVGVGRQVLSGDSCHSGELSLNSGDTDPRTIGALSTTPLVVTSLAPGAGWCLTISLQDRAQGNAATISQSDTSTWRFAIDATAT